MTIVKFNSFFYGPSSAPTPGTSPAITAFGVKQEAFEYADSGDDTAAMTQRR